MDNSEIKCKERFFEVNCDIRGKTWFLITDLRFWNTHSKEIDTWLIENTSNGTTIRQGMMLIFDNQKEALWFKLRWGGE